MTSARKPRNIKAAAFPIRSLEQLEAAFRPGRRLVKTFMPAGPHFEVQGERCDPAIAHNAIEDGWLHPADPGLPEMAVAQSWVLRKGVRS
jgi:hypothetical protein